MLIAILMTRKTIWKGQHKTGEQPYFHCGPSIRVKQEKKDVEIFVQQPVQFLEVFI